MRVFVLLVDDAVADMLADIAFGERRVRCGGTEALCFAGLNPAHSSGLLFDAYPAQCSRNRCLCAHQSCYPAGCRNLSAA